MPARRRCTGLAAAAALVLAFASGCSSDGSGATPATTAVSPSAPSTPTTDSPTPCGGAGDGVIRAACDGTATVSFELDRATDAAEGAVDGGTCETTIAYLVVFAGTETTADHPGARLDLAELQLPVEPGDFDGADLTIVWDGVEIVAAGATGRHDGASGTFAADLPDGGSVSGSFTC